MQGLVVNGWAVGNPHLRAGRQRDPRQLPRAPIRPGPSRSPNGNAINVSAPNDLVGGGTPADRNLVSGNTAGVFSGAIQFDSSVPGAIQGNLVGTDATGMLAIPNADGIYTNGPVSIGGSTPAPATSSPGTASTECSSRARSVIQGNLIGTTADGSGPLGNGQNGINLHEISDVTIGGQGDGDGNVIAYNGAAGVLVSQLGAERLRFAATPCTATASGST